MTPSFIGRIAMMFPGLRPSISLASLPTASIFPVFWLIATMEGSLTTIPFPFAKTIVLAVPRSIAKSFEKRLSRERGDQVIIGPLSTRKRLPAAWIEDARARAPGGSQDASAARENAPPACRRPRDFNDFRLVSDSGP